MRITVVGNFLSLRLFYNCCLLTKRMFERKAIFDSKIRKYQRRVRDHGLRKASQLWIPPFCSLF